MSFSTCQYINGPRGKVRRLENLRGKRRIRTLVVQRKQRISERGPLCALCELLFKLLCRRSCEQQLQPPLLLPALKVSSAPGERYNSRFAAKLQQSAMPRNLGRAFPPRDERPSMRSLNRFGHVNDWVTSASVKTRSAVAVAVILVTLLGCATRTAAADAPPVLPGTQPLKTTFSQSSSSMRSSHSAGGGVVSSPISM